MRTATLASLAVSFLAAGLFAACADGGQSDEQPSGHADGGADTGHPVQHDSGGTQDSGHDAGVCVSHCTQDIECAQSCPNIPNGVQCCDTQTGRCFAQSGNQCPAPVDDAGVDSPTY